MSTAKEVVAEKLPAPAEVVPSKEDAKNALASQVRSLAAGGFGGVCAVVVGHPFDLVKVRLQTAESGVYKGAIDVVKKSIARDGLRRGLYAGVSAPLVGVTPMCKKAPAFPPSVAKSNTCCNQSLCPSGATTSVNRSSAPCPPSPPKGSPSARSQPPASSPPSP